MVIRRGDRSEVVTRPGHLDLRTALDLAAANDGKLMVMRHVRQPPGAPQPTMVRIIQGETGV